MSAKNDEARRAAGQTVAGSASMNRPEKAVLPAGKYEKFGEDMTSVNTTSVKIKAQSQTGPTQPRK